MNSLLLVLLTFVITFLAGILSGLSGGGAGFITMPYYLLLGLPPAEAVATSKLGSLGNSFGSLTAFRGKGLVDKKRALPFVIITLLSALASAWLIPQINTSYFQKTLGIILLVLTPSLFIKKEALEPGERSRALVITGFITYTFFAFLQTLIGAGIGSLLVLILMFLFGLTALEANATKRVAQSVQAFLLFILLGWQGLVTWTHGLAGLLGSSVGTHIGSRLAIKKGNDFMKIAMTLLMAASGIVLLLS